MCFHRFPEIPYSTAQTAQTLAFLFILKWIVARNYPSVPGRLGFSFLEISEKYTPMSVLQFQARPCGWVLREIRLWQGSKWRTNHCRFWTKEVREKEKWLCLWTKKLIIWVSKRAFFLPMNWDITLSSSSNFSLLAFRMGLHRQLSWVSSLLTHIFSPKNKQTNKPSELFYQQKWVTREWQRNCNSGHTSYGKP